jgi:hypothetical protein
MMVPDALHRLVVSRKRDSGRGNLLSLDEAAKLLNVTQAAVRTWIESKRLFALRGELIPAEQILAGGDVVPGIAQVLTIIPDAEAAWDFLDEESAFVYPEKSVRPIEALREGKVEAVVAAAHSFLEAFS